MERLFISGENICQNNCAYCFARWNQYNKIRNESELVTNECKPYIIYPLCDSELYYQGESKLKEILDKASTIERGMISISTKSNWSDAQLDMINKHNMDSSVKVKLSVSITTKSKTGLIESNCIDYGTRIELLRRIRTRNIPSNIILKPILPFIEYDEYEEIIDDCIGICNLVVIGGLYIEKDSSFFLDYIKGKYKTNVRKCGWLGETKDYVEHERYHEIKNMIERKGYRCYESDLDLIRDMW